MHKSWLPLHHIVQCSYPDIYSVEINTCMFPASSFTVRLCKHLHLAPIVTVTRCCLQSWPALFSPNIYVYDAVAAQLLSR